MAALRGLPEPLVVEDLARMEHRFPYFDVDVVSVDGELSVNSVQTLASGSGFVYHGTVSNGFDVAVGGPSVTLFAVNQVGRPVGIATSTLPDGIPAGGNAPFETTALSDPGVGYVAFAEAALLP
jgi:hypothetical protein